MGCRGQVKIAENSDVVYLYTHWGAGELPAIVKSALAKRWCWDDFEYLARIIFDEMIGDSQGGETGFGIGVAIHGDIECLVIVDCVKQAIEIDRSMYGGKKEPVVSFEDFVST